jgi:hypothetical protein
MSLLVLGKTLLPLPKNIKKIKIRIFTKLLHQRVKGSGLMSNGQGSKVKGRKLYVNVKFQRSKVVGIFYINYNVKWSKGQRVKGSKDQRARVKGQRQSFKGQMVNERSKGQRSRFKRSKTFFLIYIIYKINLIINYL